MSNKKTLLPGIKLGGMDLSKLGDKWRPDDKSSQWMMREMDRMFAYLTAQMEQVAAQANANNTNLVALARILKISPEQLMDFSHDTEANKKFIDECMAYEEKKREEELQQVGDKMENEAEELAGPSEETKAMVAGLTPDEATALDQDGQIADPEGMEPLEPEKEELEPEV